MSSVLRKKIQAGVGMPPAILQFDDFWEPLQASVASWFSGTYAIETRASPESRRMVQGNIARSHLETLSYFIFNSRFSPGLCAIGVDEAGVAMNAHHRLQQPGDNLEGVSELFRKLLLETPVVELIGAALDIVEVEDNTYPGDLTVFGRSKVDHKIALLRPEAARSGAEIRQRSLYAVQPVIFQSRGNETP